MAVVAKQQGLSAWLHDAAAGAATPRQRWARLLFAASMFALPATVISTPLGLRLSVLLALLALILAPEQWCRAAWRYRRASLPLWLLAAVAIGLVYLSQTLFDLRLSDNGNRTRTLMLPICFVGVLAYRPHRSLFWAGALVGLLGALVVTLVQCLGGEARAHGWTNAIVFADVVLALVVVAIFLRPPGLFGWALAGAGMGVVAIGLSGSRGVWLAGIIALSVGFRVAWRRMTRRGFVLLSLATVVLLCALAPRLDTRVEQFYQDLVRFEHGDADSSVGARLQMLALAAQTVSRHPWTGVGVDRFSEVIRDVPDCAGASASRNDQLCGLKHAHSDLAEWAATLGIPGLLCIMALYLLPLWMCWRALRVYPRPDRECSAALAGAVMILVFFACGLSQSIYAHQLTAACYAMLTGTLLAFARLEAEGH